MIKTIAANKPEFECGHQHGTYFRKRLIGKPKSDRLNQTRNDIAPNPSKSRLQYPVLLSNCRTVKCPQCPIVKVARIPWSCYQKNLNDVEVK